MTVKEDIKDRFVSSMLRFVNAVKGESEVCSEICGGFNEKELQVVVFVGQHTSVKMTYISENLNSPLSTLTSVVDKLVEKKFLTRVHSVEDRRVVNVTLTPKGKNAYKTFLNRKDIMAEKVLSLYALDEQGVFIGFLDKMSTSIESLK
jgi:DNA-binding MarR family transcriptional regulator